MIEFSKYAIRHPTKYNISFKRKRSSRTTHHHHHQIHRIIIVIRVRAKVRHVSFADMIDGTVSNYVWRRFLLHSRRQCSSSFTILPPPPLLVYWFSISQPNTHTHMPRTLFPIQLVSFEGTLCQPTRLFHTTTTRQSLGKFMTSKCREHICWGEFRGRG